MRNDNMGLIPLFNNQRKTFEAQIRPHLRNLYQQAWRLTGHQQDAEDVVQELVLGLYRKKTDLSEIDNPHTWLMKALYHQFVDYYRKQQRSPLNYKEEGDEVLEQIRDETATPESATEQRLIRRRLQQALMTLNPDQRLLVTMHDMDGYTLSELETILDTPVGTLKSRLHRARQVLRNEIFMEPFPGNQRVTG